MLLSLKKYFPNASRFSTCSKLLQKVFLNDLYSFDGLSTEKTEVKKVLNYIQNASIEVDPNLGNAAHYKNYKMHYGVLAVKLKKEGFISGQLPAADIYGQKSSQIIQVKHAWNELLTNANVKNESVLIQDLNDLGLSLAWTIISCYLVKDFDSSTHLRYPLRIFDGVIRIPATYKCGSLSKSEKETIKKYAKANPNFENLEELSKKLNRSQRSIINKINHYKYQTKAGYTMDDVEILMLNYFNGKMPQNRLELNNCKFIKNEEILKTVGKSQRSIIQYWNVIISPTLGAHLDGKLQELFQLKAKVIEFIIKTKAKTPQDIDLEHLQKLYPYITKAFILDALRDVFYSMKKNPGPLYEHCENYLKKKNAQVQFTERYKSSRLMIVQVFESLKPK